MESPVAWQLQMKAWITEALSVFAWRGKYLCDNNLRIAHMLQGAAVNRWGITQGRSTPNTISGGRRAISPTALPQENHLGHQLHLGLAMSVPQGLAPHATRASDPLQYVAEVSAGETRVKPVP